MDIGFGDALLIVGLLLAVSSALSGVMRGTVLSISVLSVSLGIALALADVVSVDIDDTGIVDLIELALVLTLFSDGLVVERELLTVHWSPPARALALAMPLTLGLPALIRHTLNLESGLNDGLALPFVLFFIVLATPAGNAGHEAARLLGEAAVGAVIGIALGIVGG